MEIKVSSLSEKEKVDPKYQIFFYFCIDIFTQDILFSSIELLSRWFNLTTTTKESLQIDYHQRVISDFHHRKADGGYRRLDCTHPARNFISLLRYHFVMKVLVQGN